MSPNTTNAINAIAKTCPICWEPFTASGRNAHKHTYCSPRCRKTAFERRQRGERVPDTPTNSSTTTSLPPQPLPQPAAQRDCPHCGRPVTIVALLTTPEAARPHLPITAPDRVIPLRR